jgi:Bacterial pre-peptidase C-terminal domain
MPSKALLRIALATLLFASVTQAQTLDQTLSGCNGAAPLRTIQASPSDYVAKVASLIPGDRLQLAAGTYGQYLNLYNLHGQPGQCIVIEGPASGSPALFTSSNTRNIVSIWDSSYIALRNLTLDGQGKWGDGIKAEVESVSVHHILIDGLTLRNFNIDQQVVGINVKCPAWNWVIRNTTITSAGTGMYIGGSGGEFEFTNFLVEHNLIYGTIGYNAQFKHQNLARRTSLGIPSSGTVIVRHNVFSKGSNSSTGTNARPNLLAGHWPSSGAGSSDHYQIYGNLFYDNPSPEYLFQGEGNVAFHDNLLVNRPSGSGGVNLFHHNGAPKRIDVFNNTIVVPGTGIRIANPDTAYTQRVTGNAVFAGTPLTGGQQTSNVTGTHAAASTYLNNPMAALGSGLNLYPKTGQLQGTAIDYTPFTTYLDYDRDFNGTSRVATFRGAYSGAGTNPGWTLALAIKPPASSGTGNVLQNGVPVSGISGAHASQQFWTMSVPSGASNLQFQIAGGTGDADLYVRFGSAPTTSTYDCRPFAGDSNETCSFPSPSVGTWHVMLVGDGAYSGLTLTGSYQTGGSGGVLQNGVPVTNLAGGLGSQQFWTMSVPSGSSNLQFQTSGGTGDADLYVRFGSAPTMSTWDCRPFLSGNNETCTFASPGAGTWHVMVVGDDPYSGMTLVGSYQTGPSCNAISDVEPNAWASPQSISGSCNQISGTFLNESSTSRDDYFGLSLPAGKTVTALLNGLTVNYNVYLYSATGATLDSSYNDSTTPDEVSWTNTGSSAVTVYVRVYRAASTQTTYQLRVSY